MDLVVDHVLEALVVRRAEEDLRVDLAARVAVVHDLVAPQLVVVLAEQLGYLLHVDGVVEGRGVADLALVRAQLALQVRNCVFGV